ncbi:hypothetical protein J7L87_00945 [bacterium]|nr:hypothetical protein [bacterium]
MNPKSTRLFILSILVFFTPSQKAEKIFKEKIKNAEKSIYISSYSLSSPFLINLLQKKKNIEVRIIVEKNTKSLNWKNLKFHIHNQYPIFHSKFIVIDKKYLFIGSLNYTESGFHNDRNDVVFVENEKLAEFFHQKFLSLWNGEKSSQFYRDDLFEVYFAPEYNCEKVIIEKIKKANISIKFALFSFTSDNIAKAIIRRKLAGVKVNGIIDTNQIHNSVFYILKNFGCRIKRSNLAALLHFKFFIIDDKTVITGSYNPTLSAKRNIELVFIIKKKEIAEKYRREWKKLWKWYSLN